MSCADDRAVGRDRDDFELVDLGELLGLGLGRAGHAGQRLVELEEVLERDRRQRLRLLLDRHALLGLDRLVQPVGPLPADHLAAGVFVDDDDFHLAGAAAALDDVVLVLLVDDVGPQRLLHQVRPLHVVADVEAADARGLLRGGDAFVGEVDALAVQLDLVVLREPFLLLLRLLELLLGLGLALRGPFPSRPCPWPCPRRPRRP